MKSRFFTTLCLALDDKEMDSRAKRCALLGRASPASVEEREEKSSIFREERKAV